MARSDRGRRRREQPTEPFISGADAHDRLRQRVHVSDRRRACGREVALLGEVRALRELHPADQLRHQDVEIGIALTVAVRRHIHRHPRERRREVGAVIEVEAAQVVLIGFPLAAVLRDHDAWNGLEHFASAHDRPRIELPRGDRALTRGLRDADQILRRPLGVGEVRERALAGHRHIGVQRQLHHDVDGGRTAGDDDGSRGRREVEQGEGEVVLAGVEIEAINTRGVADGRGRRRARAPRQDGHARSLGAARLDGHAGQGAPGLVADDAGHGRGKRGGSDQPEAERHDTAPEPMRPHHSQHLACSSNGGLYRVVVAQPFQGAGGRVGMPRAFSTTS